MLDVCRGLYGNIEIGICEASLDGVLDCLCRKCGILQECKTLIEFFEDHFHGFKSLRGNAGLKGGVRVCRGRFCRSCIHVGVLFHNGTLQSQAYLSRLHNQMGCDSLSASFLSWPISAVSYWRFEERILVQYLQYRLSQLSTLFITFNTILFCSCLPCLTSVSFLINVWVASHLYKCDFAHLTCDLM